MPQLVTASPKFSVWLFKTIDRRMVSDGYAASDRYQGQDPYIDLTPHFGEGSSVRTSKSVREPAGGFTLAFADSPHTDWSNSTLETVYGLVEPMDIIEIRMWRGVGNFPAGSLYPIVMRGFVSEVSRSQTMGADGRPQRTVTVSGQDYGKIWQMYQVLHFPAYSEGKALLTSFAMAELFGGTVVNATPAKEFIRKIVDGIINPFLAKFLPDSLHPDIPKKIKCEDGMLVAHGQVNLGHQNMQGSLYDIMKFHGDVPVWNELYTEDREDGVHCMYRPVPAKTLATSEKIQTDAPDLLPMPIIGSQDIESVSVARTDANVANFYWVNNSRFDLISESSRKLFGITVDNNTVSLKDYRNSAVKYYGVRPMYAETQQGGDDVKNMNSGLEKSQHEARDTSQSNWIADRRRILMEMNKDNVVFERGSIRLKGGQTRVNGRDLIRAGDYILVQAGTMFWGAYVTQVEHEFVPFQGYTTTLIFERGTGFAARVFTEGGRSSPYLSELRG